MKGKSSKPNSGTTVASEVVDADSISWVPPRSADCCCNSLPSCDEANSRTFSLPPLLADKISANFCTPKLTGWSVLLRCPQRIVRSSCADAAPAKSAAPNTAADRILHSLIISSLKHPMPIGGFVCFDRHFGEDHITKPLSNENIRNI